MSLMGHSRLGEASWRSNHVRNAPLATVGPKKAACRDGPIATFPLSALRRALGDDVDGLKRHHYLAGLIDYLDERGDRAAIGL
jgi:hypothetical protein